MLLSNEYSRWMYSPLDSHGAAVLAAQSLDGASIGVATKDKQNNILTRIS